MFRERFGGGEEQFENKLPVNKKELGSNKWQNADFSKKEEMLKGGVSKEIKEKGPGGVKELVSASVKIAIEAARQRKEQR